MKTKHSTDNGVGGLNQCHMTCSFFPPSSLLTESTGRGLGELPVPWVGLLPGFIMGGRKGKVADQQINMILANCRY